MALLLGTQQLAAKSLELWNAFRGGCPDNLRFEFAVSVGDAVSQSVGLTPDFSRVHLLQRVVITATANKFANLEDRHQHEIEVIIVGSDVFCRDAVSLDAIRHAFAEGKHELEAFDCVRISHRGASCL